jgi:hypothetical protein
MLSFLTVCCMLLVGYAFVRQGLVTAFAMTVNVFLAGVVAFNFWEPLAGLLEGPLADTFLRGTEDCLSLVAIFSLTLGLLRLTTNHIVRTEVEFPAVAQQGGAALCGLVAGYLVAGFLVCVAQTLPWHENFLGFGGATEKGEGVRRVLPPDRVWLATMRRASVLPLSRSDAPGFDPHGSFELRYERHRRSGEKPQPLPYGGDDIPVSREASPR